MSRQQDFSDRQCFFHVRASSFARPGFWRTSVADQSTSSQSTSILQSTVQSTRGRSCLASAACVSCCSRRGAGRHWKFIVRPEIICRWLEDEFGLREGGAWARAQRAWEREQRAGWGWIASGGDSPWYESECREISVLEMSFFSNTSTKWFD